MSLDGAIHDAVKAATAEWLEKHAEAPIAKRLLTTAEAAEYLGVSPPYVRNLIAAGELQGINIAMVGRKEYRFDIHDLEQWIAKRKGAAA